MKSRAKRQKAAFLSSNKTCHLQGYHTPHSKLTRKTKQELWNQPQRKFLTKEIRRCPKKGMTSTQRANCSSKNFSIKLCRLGGPSAGSDWTRRGPRGQRLLWWLSPRGTTLRIIADQGVSSGRAPPPWRSEVLASTSWKSSKRKSTQICLGSKSKKEISTRGIWQVLKLTIRCPRFAHWSNQDISMSKLYLCVWITISNVSTTKPTISLKIWESLAPRSAMISPTLSI